MKRVIPFIFILAILMAGCGSSKKQLERGNYDAAIDRSVKQLRKDPNDSKQMSTLMSAYKVAKDRDEERVRFLKMENRPDSWDEIYQVYQRLYDRQNLVRTIPTANIQYMDYMPDLVAAKQRAADFYYAHGMELMKSNIKESYRQAYAEFIRAKQYVGDYEGIDDKIMEAKYLGMSRVFVSIQNKSILNFPKEFEDDLLTLDLPLLNSEWVEYHTANLDQNTQYDYFVNININNIAVSDNETMERDSVIKRDIEDGFEYVLDNNGNVMKDTLGNDIKLKKYKTVQCALIETVQRKACRIDGDVEVIQMNPNKVLKKDPIGAESSFEHISARALGDLQALSPQQLERTRSEALPFPTDIEMVIRCSETLKLAIRGAMLNNKRFIL